MIDVNKIILIGRLGNSPVLRQTKNGTPVAHFSLATSRRLPAAEGAESSDVKEETQWHRVVVWGKQALNCKSFLEKGQAAFVEGSIRSHKYQGKDGQERTAFEIHSDNVIFLARKKRTQDASATELASTADEALATM